MNKIKKAIVTITILMIFTAFPVYVRASAANTDIRPIWMTESRFRTDTRKQGTPASCGAFADGFRFPGMKYHTPDTLRTAILNGIINDSIFRYFIPNTDFLRAVLNTVELRIDSGFGINGYYRNEGAGSVVFIANDRFEAAFVHTALDETGHMFFGFSEAMSELFTERMQNINYSVHSPRINKIIVLYRQSGKEANIPVIGGGGILYYTNFERVFENALAENNRAIEMWDAAMGANGVDGMAELWNSVSAVSDLISREDLQSIRGIMRYIDGYAQAFEAHTGITWDEFFYRFTDDWRTLTAHLHPEYEIRRLNTYGQTTAMPRAMQINYRYQTLRRFRSMTREAVNFADVHGFLPEIDVMRPFIESHHYRNTGGLFGRK